MKTQALKRFRSRLASNEPLYGLWVTLESASITEMAVALGMDWVVIDAEHGYLDWKEINEHIRAGLRSDTVVLVRLAERSTSLSKRALDIGADGVVIPWVETVEDLEAAIRDCRYPTEGRRGIGGERATAWGQCLAEHTSEANEHVLVVPLIESVAAIPHVPAMCQVDGTDVFLFGPADLSATAGYRGQWEGPGVAGQILRLKDSIRAAGKHCGVMTTSVDNLVERREQGFHMLGVGADNGLLLRSIHQALQAVDRDRMPGPSLDPADGHDVRLPRPQPPEDTTPDRDEVIACLGDREPVELEAGVVMGALVGEFNAARGLTTGVVTMLPEALLDYPAHPCGESITVIQGEAEFIDYFNASLIPGIEMSGGFARFDPGGRLPDHLHDFDESICIIRGDAHGLVEGRQYALSNCAAALVPRGRVHYFINESANPMDMIWVYAGPVPERIVIVPGFVRK